MSTATPHPYVHEALWKVAVTQTMTENTAETTGFVTGVYIEGVVYEEIQSVIENSQPEWLHYGVNNESDWAVMVRWVYWWKHWILRSDGEYPQHW